VVREGDTSPLILIGLAASHAHSSNTMVFVKHRLPCLFGFLIPLNPKTICFIVGIEFFSVYCEVFQDLNQLDSFCS
jgi:hypothetical protein